MDEIPPEKVDAILKPEYPFSKVHPSVLRDEQTEPWLIATPDDRPVMPARSFAKAFYSFDPG